MAGAEQGADDVLHVDGRAFVAIDGDAGVGAEVGDVFCHVWVWVGFTYRVATRVYVNGEWMVLSLREFSHPLPGVP